VLRSSLLIILIECVVWEDREKGCWSSSSWWMSENVQW
jgi:hypothetical protein